MSPAIKNRHFTLVIKFLLVGLLAFTVVFLFAVGNAIIRSLVLLSIITGAVIKIRKHRISKSSEYDEIGYWSGLDDFEIGIDYDLFEDMELTEDDIDLGSGDIYKSRPV